MANTQSAKKAIRGSERKRQHNLFWKRRIKAAARSVSIMLEDSKADTTLINENLTVLQKILDKAVKKNVIHKNKANRLKSRYAKKISARTSEANTKTKAKVAPTKAKAKSGTKKD